MSQQSLETKVMALQRKLDVVIRRLDELDSMVMALQKKNSGGQLTVATEMQLVNKSTAAVMKKMGPIVKQIEDCMQNLDYRVGCDSESLMQQHRNAVMTDDVDSYTKLIEGISCGGGDAPGYGGAGRSYRSGAPQVKGRNGGASITDHLHTAWDDNEKYM